MELLIKKKVYLKPYQKSFERVNFSVKFEVVGVGRETMAVRGWLWVVLVKLWQVVDSRGQWWQNFGLPCVAVDGCAWCRSNYGWSWMVVCDLSISLIFMEKVKSFTAFLTLNVSRERTFYLQTKIDTVGLIGRLILVGY